MFNLSSDQPLAYCDHQLYKTKIYLLYYFVSNTSCIICIDLYLYIRDITIEGETSFNNIVQQIINYQ